jgi:hypothetical protein
VNIIRHLIRSRKTETAMTDDQREAFYDQQRRRSIARLGDKYVLSPNYSGHYKPELHPLPRATH